MAPAGDIHSRLTPFKSFRLCLIVFCFSLASVAVLGDASLDSRIRMLEVEGSVSESKAGPLMQRILLLQQRGDSDAAAALLHRAKLEQPDLPLNFIEGVLLFERGEYSAAQGVLSEALKSDPKSFWGIYYRAQSLAAVGDLANAVQDYQRLFQLRSDLSPGYYLTVVNWLVERDDRGLDEAIVLLDQRMGEVGYLSVLLQRAIELETARGNIASAIDRSALFDARMRAAPEWKLRLAELLIKADRPADAEAYLKIARVQLESTKRTPARLQTQGQLIALEHLLKQRRIADSGDRTLLGTSADTRQL